MEKENTAKAGGDAESKGVDDTPEQETGGETEGKKNNPSRAGGDAESRAGGDAESRAGGDAESKGVD